MSHPKTISRRGWALANAFAIPGTGRFGTGHYFRRPHNISVKRGLLAVFDHLKGVKVPPDNYDDLHVTARSDRNWKRFRKTRWKEQS